MRISWQLLFLGYGACIRLLGLWVRLDLNLVVALGLHVLHLSLNQRWRRLPKVDSFIMIFDRSLWTVYNATTQDTLLLIGWVISLNNLGIWWEVLLSSCRFVHLLVNIIAFCDFGWRLVWCDGWDQLRVDSIIIVAEVVLVSIHLLSKVEILFVYRLEYFGFFIQLCLIVAT